MNKELNVKYKICTECKLPKNLEGFSADKRHKDGKQSRCKKCYKDYIKKYPWKKTLDGIKQRCNNVKNPRYKDYGGRGIKCLITLEEVKSLWYAYKAYLMNKPSIDRKDNNGDYTFDNCQYMELGENAAKDSSKAINQYDLQGKFIKIWKGARAIARALGYNQGYISGVCRGIYKQAYNYKWNFADER